MKSHLQQNNTFYSPKKKHKRGISLLKADLSEGSIVRSNDVDGGEAEGGDNCLVKAVHGDLRDLDLSTATIIVLYLLTESVQEIKPMLLRAIENGCVVVCNTWGMKGVPEVEKKECGPCGNVVLWKYDWRSLLPLADRVNHNYGHNHVHDHGHGIVEGAATTTSVSAVKLSSDMCT